MKGKVADLRTRCQQLQSWMQRAKRAIHLHHQFDPSFLGAAVLGREKFNAVVECFDVVSMTPCYISDLARFVADEGDGDEAAEGMRAWAISLANMIQALERVHRLHGEVNRMLLNAEVEMAKQTQYAGMTSSLQRRNCKRSWAEAGMCDTSIQVTH